MKFVYKEMSYTKRTITLYTDVKINWLKVVYNKYLVNNDLFARE